jgi:hypothetical protein
MFFNNKTKKLLQDAQEELIIVNSELSKTKTELSSAKFEIQKIKELLDNSQNKLDECKELNNSLKEKYHPLIQRDEVLEKRNKEIEIAENKLLSLNEKYQSALIIHSNLKNEINLYQDTLEIGSFGLYKPQFNYDTSEKYKLKLETIYNTQKNLIKNESAIICKTEWEVGGSKVEGRKMTSKYKKLMLFAFNGECESCITKVKWNNVEKIKARILKAFESINKLGESHNIYISDYYLKLKLDELSLTYEYEQKKYEEKEEQRIIREQMREEERSQKELEKAQKEAEEEEKRFEKALEKAKQELTTTPASSLEFLNEQIKLLEQKLQEAHERKERALSLAQQTKVGHIYVISNIGSFGEDIYKIGMTRRLDPLDRVKELGDASVPFQFDVHAIIYSENAPQLEYDLHKYFTNKRLNKINNKKEFFKVSLLEIEEFIAKNTNAEIQFTKVAEAREYRETMTFINQLDANKNIETKENIFPSALL